MMRLPTERTYMTPEQALTSVLNILTGQIAFESLSEQEYQVITRRIAEISETMENIRVLSENAVMRESMMPFAALNGK